MDKGGDTGREEAPSAKIDIEDMPRECHYHGPFRHQKVRNAVTSAFSMVFSRVLILLGLWLAGLLIPTQPADAQTDDSRQKKKADPNGYDIAFVIDNRDEPTTDAAKKAAEEDVKAITDMLDRHLFADHIVQLQRPSYAMICDIFGGCPEEAGRPWPWPSLISKVAHRATSRLYVYYLGPARVQGLERQFLFDRRSRAYTVGWLHKQLEKTAPKSSLVFAETSFSPLQRPCANGNPWMINATMKTAQRSYAQIMEGRGLPRGLAELSAALPAEISHCDRYEQIVDRIERPLFTKFVLKGVVQGLADQAPFGDQDGFIELGELAAYIRPNIERAVQFQWGREQHVWQIGPGSRTIARVTPRDPTFEEREKPGRKKKTITKRKDDERPKPPDKPEQHVCDIDQNSEACVLFCAENRDDFRCRFIGVCLDEPISESCPCMVGDPRPGCRTEGSWCHWSEEALGPVTEAVATTIGATSTDACQWATRDERNIVVSVLWELFAPIGWRLVRPLVRRTTACALNCQGRARPITASIDDAEAFRSGGALAASVDRVASDDVPPPIRSGLLSRRPFTDEVCSSDLPPYIGLPRWMPGTLVISETLRSILGCQPKRLFVFGMPPPVTLVEAPQPPLPPPPPPGPIAMPPPIDMPPIRFDQTVSRVRWLQSALTIGNYNPGPIDGTMGKRTAEAIDLWRHNKGLDNLGSDLGEAEFRLIMTEYGEMFDQVHPSAPLY